MLHPAYSYGAFPLGSIVIHNGHMEGAQVRGRTPGPRRIASTEPVARYGPGSGPLHGLSAATPPTTTPVSVPPSPASVALPLGLQPPQLPPARTLSPRPRSNSPPAVPPPQYYAHHARSFSPLGAVQRSFSPSVLLVPHHMPPRSFSPGGPPVVPQPLRMSSYAPVGINEAGQVVMAPMQQVLAPPPGAMVFEQLAVQPPVGTAGCVVVAPPAAPVPAPGPPGTALQVPVSAAPTPLPSGPASTPPAPVVTTSSPDIEKKRAEHAEQLAQWERTQHEATKQQLARTLVERQDAIKEKDEALKQLSDRPTVPAEQASDPEKEQLVKKNEELNQRVRSLSEQVSMLQNQVSTLPAVETRRQAAEDAARKMEADKRLQELELDKWKDAASKAQQETRDLRCKYAMAEEQLRELKEMNEQLKSTKDRSETDYQRIVDRCTSWSDHASKLEEEKLALRAELDKVVGDVERQKSVIKELEWQLAQEGNATDQSISDFERCQKALQAAMPQAELALENDTLKIRLAEKSAALRIYESKFEEQQKRIKEFSGEARGGGA